MEQQLMRALDLLKTYESKLDSAVPAEHVQQLQVNKQIHVYTYSNIHFEE